MPYRSSTLIAAKLAAILAAWVLSSVPALSALAIWRLFGGHLSAPETLNLLFGHLRSPHLRRSHRIVCCVSFGRCGDRRDRHALLHDRLVGVGFYGGRSSWPSRMGRKSVVDPSVAHVRAGPAIGRSCRGHWHGCVQFRRACDRLASAPRSCPQ